MVRSALEQGNLLVIAGDGRQALGMVSEQRFDLVLCDLRMSGMDEREFSSSFR